MVETKNNHFLETTHFFLRYLQNLNDLNDDGVPPMFPKKSRNRVFHEEVNICKIDMYKYFMVETKTTFSET